VLKKKKACLLEKNAIDMQTTSHLLMIRPVNFGYNPQTAVNNAFQVPGSGQDAQQKALAEFDDFVNLLQAKGVDVTVIQDSPEPHTPDSIFPNNWVSFHSDGTICLYPMFAENRRAERKPDVLNRLKKRFRIDKTIDFSEFESGNQFLEGTGSMVLDRESKIAYACLSPRTDPEVLEIFCQKLGYRAMTFDAVDGSGLAIYHTNVMMCVADKYVVICLDSLPDPKQKSRTAELIRSTGKQIIEISFDQMLHFAGNMLQVENAEGKKLLVMSSQAFNSLLPGQLQKLREYNEIVHSDLTTIETNGGGSARCMMAEVHLPQK